MKFLDAPRTIDVVGSLAPSALSYHPNAPGPSRPTREREQKAEQHLEDRVDNRRTRYGKPAQNSLGLAAGRRFTEGISIPVWSEGSALGANPEAWARGLVGSAWDPGGRQRPFGWSGGGWPAAARNSSGSTVIGGRRVSGTPRAGHRLAQCSRCDSGCSCATANVTRRSSRM